MALSRWFSRFFSGVTKSSGPREPHYFECMIWDVRQVLIQMLQVLTVDSTLLDTKDKVVIKDRPGFHPHGSCSLAGEVDIF